MVVFIFGYQIMIKFEVIIDGAEIEQLYLPHLWQNQRFF